MYHLGAALLQRSHRLVVVHLRITPYLYHQRLLLHLHSRVIKLRIRPHYLVPHPAFRHFQVRIRLEINSNLPLAPISDPQMLPTPPRFKQPLLHLVVEHRPRPHLARHLHRQCSMHRHQHRLGKHRQVI